MDTQLFAHYSNRFDTWAGRKQSTNTELIAQFADEYTAQACFDTLTAYITAETDLADLVQFELVGEGGQLIITETRKTGGYARNAEDYAKSWEE